MKLTKTQVKEKFVKSLKDPVLHDIETKLQYLSDKTFPHMGLTLEYEKLDDDTFVLTVKDPVGNICGFSNAAQQQIGLCICNVLIAYPVNVSLTASLPFGMIMFHVTRKRN